MNQLVQKNTKYSPEVQNAAIFGKGIKLFLLIQLDAISLLSQFDLSKPFLGFAKKVSIPCV